MLSRYPGGTTEFTWGRGRARYSGGCCRHLGQGAQRFLEARKQMEIVLGLFIYLYATMFRDGF